MSQEYLFAQEWLKTGKRVALATVIETWGSAPRPVGSHLVIDEDGRFEGSVSGGCVESAVVSDAMDVIETSIAKTLNFGVADAAAWEVGLSCGGKISIYVEPLTLDMVTPILEDYEARREHTVSHGAFTQTYKPPLRLVITGAVHISQMLVPLAKSIGLDTVIIDPRTAFATPERFPDVTIHAVWVQDILPVIKLDKFTAFVALTHDPKIDDPALIAALNAECFYIGALGSRKTHEKRVERLNHKDIARIKAPIGLDIGAISPAEIAIAIIAEIMAER
jgi:xanthine dehydrogenase accessory factor